MPRSARRSAGDREIRPLEDRLSEYVVEAAEAGEARLRCPRTDCGEEFTVNRDAFREGRGEGARFRTRPCPYCFRVNLVPTSAPGPSR